MLDWSGGGAATLPGAGGGTGRPSLGPAGLAHLGVSSWREIGRSFPVFFGLLPHPAAQVPVGISTTSQHEAMDSLDPPEMQLQLKHFFSPPPSPLPNALSPTQTPHRVSFLSF